MERAMKSHNLAARIKVLEQNSRLKGYHPDCICFPENEQPSVAYPIELEILASIKCPLHGDRFRPQYYIVYMAKWLREGRWAHLWTQHSEQYRKAWFASFPPDLCPSE